MAVDDGAVAVAAFQRVIATPYRARSEVPRFCEGFSFGALADEDGMVQGPLVDTAGQMSDLILASRHYQMNLQVVGAAEEAYRSALGIGRP